MASKKAAIERARDMRLRREFGITLAQYNAVLEFQGGKCAICNRPVREFKTRLAVDHSHTSGLLRGLLCWRCNKALGVFRDDLNRLRAAVEYLISPPITTVLGVATYTAPGRVGTKKRAKLLAAMKGAK
jgi:hypothetical protein